MNMRNKKDRNSKMTIKSLQILGRKQAQGCILKGWGLKWQFAKLVGWGRGWYYMYKQHSIVKTGNFNADFKLLTRNWYSVLNGHFVCQIHLSSLQLKNKLNNIDVSVLKKIICYLLFVFDTHIFMYLIHYTCQISRFSRNLPNFTQYSKMPI